MFSVFTRPFNVLMQKTLSSNCHMKGWPRGEGEKKVLHNMRSTYAVQADLISKIYVNFAVRQREKLWMRSWFRKTKSTDETLKNKTKWHRKVCKKCEEIEKVHQADSATLLEYIRVCISIIDRRALSASREWAKDIFFGKLKNWFR